MLLTALVFLLILSALVLIHEAGHYFVAKKLGIKVEEFGFGFPLTPALFSFKHGETVYSFYPLLIGGFVKLYGEDDAGGGKITSSKSVTSGHVKDAHRAFFSRSAGQRIAVVVAGVVMNVFLAAFVYYIFLGMSNFRTELPLIGKHQFFLVNQQIKTDVVISAVSKSSPAEKAGIAPFSKVVAVNGQKVQNVEMFTSLIKENKGKEVVMDLHNLKTEKDSVVTVTPRVNPPKNEGALGVVFFPAKTVVLSYDTPVQKVLSGFVHPTNLMAYNFDVLSSLIGIAFKEKTVKPVSENLSGPIGIYSIVGTIIEIPGLRDRVLQLLNLTGLLSISLAFFNVLPIPGLDGGRLFFIVLELITGKKVNPKVEGYMHTVGIMLLIGLLLLITVKDIGQFFK